METVRETHSRHHGGYGVSHGSGGRAHNHEAITLVSYHASPRPHNQIVIDVRRGFGCQSCTVVPSNDDYASWFEVLLLPSDLPSSSPSPSSSGIPILAPFPNRI